MTQMEETQRPRVAPPVVENIPLELRQRRQWVVWAYEKRGEKWTKVPYTPGTINKARSNAPQTWRAFSEAWDTYQARPDFFAGIGYMFSKTDPYVGGDRDHSTDLEGIPPTYAEISPSGEGIKFIAKSQGHYGRKTVRGELYSSGRFFTITGNVIEGHRIITECQPAIDAFLESLGGVERKGIPSPHASNGSRAQLAAAVPEDDWKEGRRLLREELNRLLARLRASATSKEAQLYYILREEYGALHQRWPGAGVVRGDGSIDSSQIRAIFANGVRMRRFTFPEFVALFYHFYGAECVAKWGTPAAFREEAAVLWARARLPRTGDIKTPEPQPIARGRASDLMERTYQVLLTYRAGINAIVMLEQVAADLDTHKATVSRNIKGLVEAGRITSERYGSRGGLLIHFTSELIYSNGVEHTNGENDGPVPAENKAGSELIYSNGVEHQKAQNEVGVPAEKEAASAIDQLIYSDAPDTELGSTIVRNSMGVLPGERGEDAPIYIECDLHPTVFLPVSRNSQKRDLSDLAANYLDLPPEQVGERIVNTETGAITYRRSAQHFAALVAAEYSYTAEQARAAYGVEQERRKQLEKDAWERFFKSLRQMTNDELLAYVVGGCRREVAELARGDGMTFDKHLYKTRLKCAKQHVEWRGLKLPSRGEKPVTPRKKEKAVIAQQGMLNLVESERRDTAGLVERLWAAKARRQNE